MKLVSIISLKARLNSETLNSGIFILLDQSVHVGDIIELDGKVGRVEEIKLRTDVSSEDQFYASVTYNLLNLNSYLFLEF